MNRPSLHALLAVAVVLLLGTQSGLPAAEKGFKPPKQHDPRIFPVQSHPYGQSYEEWAVKFWQGLLAIPADQNPVTSGDCSPVRPGPVWFMAAPFGATMNCTIPARMAIFFPMITYENDFPCPDPTFVPPPGQTLEEFLAEGARAVIDHVEGLDLVIDGVSIDEEDLFEHRVESDLFMFTGDPSLIATFDSCITGDSQPAVTDGYWFMLAPPSVGNHQIEVTVVMDDGTILHTINNIKVVPKQEK